MSDAVGESDDGLCQRLRHGGGNKAPAQSGGLLITARKRRMRWMRELCATGRCAPQAPPTGHGPKGGELLAGGPAKAPIREGSRQYCVIPNIISYLVTKRFTKKSSFGCARG